MNKLIEQLVEQTFNNTENSSESSWHLIYVPNLKSYWLKEKNWFFPESLFSNIDNQGHELGQDHEMANLFGMHNSVKFYAKKNEEDNSLVLYSEIIDIQNAA
jgi:hypothetical protein